MPFVIACLEAGDFVGECLSEEFCDSLFFVSQVGLDFGDAVRDFAAVAFVLESESFAFGFEERAVVA